MALADVESQGCLCAWIASLGDGPKTQLRTFVAAARTILETYKAVWLLVNADYEDIYKKQLAELALSLYQQVTAPIEMPMRYLVSQTAPFSDCPPVANLAQVVKDIAGYVLGPVKKLEFEIQQFIEAIEINQAQSETIDNLIKSLDDIVDAIDAC